MKRRPGGLILGSGQHVADNPEALEREALELQLAAWWPFARVAIVAESHDPRPAALGERDQREAARAAWANWLATVDGTSLADQINAITGAGAVLEGIDRLMQQAAPKIPPGRPREFEQAAAASAWRHVFGPANIPKQRAAALLVDFFYPDLDDAQQFESIRERYRKAFPTGKN